MSDVRTGETQCELRTVDQLILNSASVRRAPVFAVFRHLTSDIRHLTSAMNDPILLLRDGAVATLTLNRPEALNTLDLAMMDALVTHSTAVAADRTCACVVMRGAGQALHGGRRHPHVRRRCSPLPPAERQAAFTRHRSRVCTPRSRTSADAAAGRRARARRGRRLRAVAAVRMRPGDCRRRRVFRVGVPATSD